MKRTYIVEKPDFEVWIGTKIVILPVGMVFTHKDGEPEIFLLDGRAAILSLHDKTEFVREIPYPLERSSSITGYQELIRKIVCEMEDALGIRNVSIEATNSNVTIHIGEG